MKSALSATLSFLFIILSVPVAAQTSQLKLDGDLIIHPAQIAKFLDSAATDFSKLPAWDWPQLQFTKPYKTNWSDVQAKGPFSVRFLTSRLELQEVGFDLVWNEPAVEIGKFEIHDRIVRKEGSNTVIIHLDGECKDMSVRFPGGQWHVKGILKWDWVAGQLQIGWHDFQFEGNRNAEAQVDMGRCEGPNQIRESLHETIVRMGKDPQWMQDVMRDGVLDFIESSMVGLQEQILSKRQMEIKPGLTLGWRPSVLTSAGAGMIRVAGQLGLVRKSRVDSEKTIARGYDEDSLASVGESGFVLPRETLPEVVRFMQAGGDLGFRVASREVEAFTKLMQSRFKQFFVWPDLMAFKKSTNFWFDVGVQQPPSIGDGKSMDGVLKYQMEVPIVIHQWAPNATEYLPYMDFTTMFHGGLLASIQDGNLTIQLQSEKLDVQSKVRSEYNSKVRKVNPRISHSALSSQVTEYLAEKPFKVKLPDWQLSTSFSLGVRDLGLTEKSFHIPLEIKNNK